MCSQIKGEEHKFKNQRVHAAYTKKKPNEKNPKNTPGIKKYLIL
jgi:hypothetical protein